jgi:hypothetical protein
VTETADRARAYQITFATCLLCLLIVSAALLWWFAHGDEQEVLCAALGWIICAVLTGITWRLAAFWTALAQRTLPVAIVRLRRRP